MDNLVPFLLAIAMLVGHVAWWTWLYNRLHASGLPSRCVHKLEKFVVLAMLCSLLIPVSWIFALGHPWLPGAAAATHWPAPTWAVLCWCMLAYVTVAWGIRRWRQRCPAGVLSNDTRIVNLKQTIGSRLYGDRATRLLGGIPGNQILEVHWQHKVLEIARLPPQLEGLRIAQVTDLHMTGQLAREFFEVAIEQTNRWEAEMVAITGDLVDNPACIEWIPGTLGRLTSQFGAYALLGNHDQRLDDVSRLRRALVDCGIEDVGGRSVIRRLRGVDVLLSGNECPWFPPAPDVPAFASEHRPFSLLLSHSPDPLPWARRHGFDLMLAGHTHGGQIRFPLVGPVVCPSRFGVRYASGSFYAPPTLLHVSRGLSGVHPLRFNCPPEITLLELRPPRA